MPVVYVVFAFITAITLGPIIIIFSYLHFRGRAVSRKELNEIQRDISQIKSDIADIKEQIAEFIIKTN